MGRFAQGEHEVGGFLFPNVNEHGQWVCTLKNVALDPVHQMLFQRDQFIKVGTEYLRNTDYEWEDLTVWHTHPGGNIGPSRMDMKNRIPEMGNLVITIVNGEVIPTWF